MCSQPTQRHTAAFHLNSQAVRAAHSIEADELTASAHSITELVECDDALVERASAEKRGPHRASADILGMRLRNLQAQVSR